MLKQEMIHAMALKKFLDKREIWEHNDLKPFFENLYHQWQQKREAHVLLLLDFTNYNIKNLDEMLNIFGREVVADLTIQDLIDA